MAVIRALIGGGGVYLYIRVFPDEFLLKSTLMITYIKRNSSGEYMNMHPPPKLTL